MRISVDAIGQKLKTRQTPRCQVLMRRSARKRLALSENPKTPVQPKKRKNGKSISATKGRGCHRGRPKGSAKKARPQLANLIPFRDVGTQTDASFFARHDAATNTQHGGRWAQPAGKRTAEDAMIAKCHWAYDKLQNASYRASTGSRT